MEKISSFIMILLLFQEVLSNKISIITYLDEGLCIISYLITIMILLKNKKVTLSKYEIKAFICLNIFIVIGLISNLWYEIVPMKYAIISILMTVKAYIIYFNCRIIFKSYNVGVEILDLIVKILKYTIYLLALIAILNIPFNFLKISDVRFGINCVSIVFSHVTEMAFFVVISVMIIIFYQGYKNKPENNTKVIIASTILIVFSGRSKAISFFIMFLIVYNYANILKKFSLKSFIIILPLGVYLAAPRIASQLIDDGARGLLYRGAINQAYDKFPLGSGFGTFGSHISRVIYSPIYYLYGFENIWGLSPQKPDFIADTYWAMIIGEGGWIGFILVGAMLYFIFIQFFKIKSNYLNKLAAGGLIIYSLLASIAEPIYSSNKSVILFITLALFITLMRKQSRDIKNNN